MGFLHDAFQIELTFVVFVKIIKNHDKFGLQHCRADIFQKYIFKQYAIIIHVQCHFIKVYLVISPCIKIAKCVF